MERTQGTKRRGTPFLYNMNHGTNTGTPGPGTTHSRPSRGQSNGRGRSQSQARPGQGFSGANGNWKGPRNNAHVPMRSESTDSSQSHQGRYFNNNDGNPKSNRGGYRNNNAKPHYDQGMQSSEARGRRMLGFKALESLLEKSPEDLMMELLNSKKGICELVKSDLTDDTIILFVKILKKVCESSFPDNQHKVLQIYLNDYFVDKLRKYVSYLPAQGKGDRRKNLYFWNDPDDFWNNLIVICKHIHDTLPHFAVAILPDILKSLVVCFPSFENEHKQHISDGIKDKIRSLNESIQIAVEEHEQKQREAIERKLTNRYVEEEEPPNDFRQISVYPNSIELRSTNDLYIRENVVKGAYRDVTHYLDVQFRLLREDFVGPLRSGIYSYLSPNTTEGRKRVENVKIHRQVRFLNPETVNHQYCARICFDFSKKKKNFKYEHSRRFMFGSLLCFTKDNFKSFIFGKISDRKIEDLEKGQLVVGFNHNVLLDYKANYVMVECSVYFEPYYHVLNALQRMSVENFPMEKYIIRVDPSVQPPQYLLAPNCLYSIGHREFSPLLTWPFRNCYNFNPSQLEAFKAALTQEFCIIQGPPGTGKTYLGLKIAKTLLENPKPWYKKTPMLVICFTNHALDQFLEGITQFTNNIIRVGGQSKNEKLSRYNLRNGQKFRMRPAVLEMRNEVQDKLRQINAVSEELKFVDLFNSIRSFDVFEDVVPDFRTTWFYTASRHQILDWLLKNRDIETQQNVTQIEEGVNNVQIAEDASESESEPENEENENFENELDDVFTVNFGDVVNVSVPLVTLISMMQKIKTLEDTVRELAQKQNPTLEELLQEGRQSAELFELKSRYDYLTIKLVEGKQTKHQTKQPPRPHDVKNPHQMSPQRRWDLYFYWLSLYKDKLLKQQENLNAQFRQSYKVYEEMRDMENSNIMRDALVIGMTTTNAARLTYTLQALKSPIVIVEEAAEVLEAHIVCSLTKHCQHLILLGDHQQLKPSTANYRVERVYKLGISMFERMVINKIQLFTLNVQHRMKPEISSLITPTIYPALEDHPSVLDRPAIKGIDNCLFFIDHAHREENCEGTSKKNFHEVEFLIYLARHLILNGYEPENITILAAYLGQMFELQKERKRHRHILENVRIAVLDNYQGEECDIILLSLVRSNKENRIGFLGIENRVCVALSRARNGFYIMGNMTQLCSTSELWPKVRATLQQQSAIGSELALRCQVHPDKVTFVKAGSDFLDISEGGCNQKCGAELACGHTCTILCHVVDRDHINYKCKEICAKVLCENALHTCRQKCYQECGPCDYPVKRILPCGHEVTLECHIDVDTYNCVVPVSTQLPCGHVCDKPCHKDAITYRCPHPCPIKVEPCGHACEMKCHVRFDPDHLEYKCKKPCARFRKDCVTEIEAHTCRKRCFEECEPCTILVKKKRFCDHVFNVACCSDVDEVECHKPCKNVLPCEHKCKRKCMEPCGRCEQMVVKIIPACGHPVKIKCWEEPSRALCNKKCPLPLPCGHPCTTNCNEKCTENCKVLVPCALRAPCGHVVTQVECNLFSSMRYNHDSSLLLPFCEKPCRDQLVCNHSCSGSCGECSRGRVHKRCTEKCGFPLVCDHPCDFPCREACRPCTRPCPYKCKHSSCGKKCGSICTPCKEKCPRSCEHRKCTKYCGDICDVPPCEEVCMKTLKCGHPCVGFCSDPCPPKCLVCDEDELTEVFFGTEEEEDARFVLLQDCGHIFESTGLEHWLRQDDGKVGFKVCPRCKTAIKTTQRYSDYIKDAMMFVAKAKMETYGSYRDNEKKRTELLARVKTLKEMTGLLDTSVQLYQSVFQPLIRLKLNTLLSDSSLRRSSLMELLDKIEQRLQIVRNGKRQACNKLDLDNIDSKLQVIDHILKICSKIKDSQRSNVAYNSQIEFIVKILQRDDDCLTQQELADINLELNRLARMVEYVLIQNTPGYAYVKTKEDVKKLDQSIEELLFGQRKFYEEDEERVKALLKELSKLVAAGIGISEGEKREIVKAMGFKQGHWYKCPNGHPYVIADCGGANQISKCNECGVKIGGTNHRLLEGNRVATEMDGATHSAWSEAANMANYQF